MNVFDFFNSPDVAAHCQSIGHTFNAFESAVIIEQSNSKSLSEKHAAFRTIIAQYPDMEIPKGFSHRHIENFHAALGKTIAYQEHELEMFLASEQGAIYQAEIQMINSNRLDTYDLGLFASYEDSLADAQIRVKAEYGDDGNTKNEFASRGSLLYT